MGHHERCIQHTFKVNDVMSKGLGINNNNNKAKVFNLRPVLICLVLIAAVWAMVFWQGLTTAIDIWIISDIFNHCLFVLPGVIYLIYLQRSELDLSHLKPNYLVLVLCVSVA